MNYTTCYFIRKFTAIPEELWTTGHYVKPNGTKCATGHCGETLGYTTDESEAFAELFSILDREAINVNDGYNDEYPQPTPKQRILAALHDIKIMEAK